MVINVLPPNITTIDIFLRDHLLRRNVSNVLNPSSLWILKVLSTTEMLLLEVTLIIFQDIFNFYLFTGVTLIFGFFWCLCGVCCDLQGRNEKVFHWLSCHYVMYLNLLSCRNPFIFFFLIWDERILVNDIWSMRLNFVQILFFLMDFCLERMINLSNSFSLYF